MRVYTYQPEGTAFVLKLAERAGGELPSGHVRIQVGACSLNYRDHIALRNLAGRKVGGRIPLSDGAGVVTEVAPDVQTWRPGDRVLGHFFQTWQDGVFLPEYHKHDLGGTLDGMLAEEVVLPATGLGRVPNGYTLLEAATLPCAAVTAWQALVSRGRLRPGAWVLALGTGGVSVFALQLAKALGAKVIITSGSTEKLQKAQTLGADALVHYKEDLSWEQTVWKLTGGRGADHVVEVGGPQTLEKSLQCVAGGGQIALIGVLTGFGPPTASLFPLMARNARLDGIYVGSAADYEALAKCLEANSMRPVIDRVFPFQDASEAFSYLASGQHFGKVVIEVARLD